MEHHRWLHLSVVVGVAYGRWSFIMERIQYKALSEDIFGVLGRWSPTEVVAFGGSTVVHNSA